MSEQYAGLSLGVDVSQVTFAVKSLKQFKRANEEAAQGVRDFVNEEQVAREKAKQLSAEVKRQRQAFDSVQSIIDPTASKIRKLTAAAADLDQLWKKGAVPDEQFFTLGAILESQISRLERNKKALTEEGRAALEESRNKEKSAKAGAAFIAGLRDQADAIGKTKSELLEMKAAQLGVSEQAAPFIAQLKSQERQLNLAGLSVGQYNQAMRMLPAQITDVVTSLASGMPIWLVAIQQGGQIKDSFGGIGNTLKVLMSYLTPARLLIGGVVATLGALAKAGHDAYSSQRELQKALIMTGGYAASSAAEIQAMVKDLAESSQSATAGQILEVATTVAQAGKFTKKQLRVITQATAEWVASTGESTDKVIGYFDKIAKDPVKGLAELNESFNFLDKGQLTYIATLEKTKGKVEATQYATELFAKTMKERAADIYDSATPLEKMWIDIKQWASGAWDTVGQVTLAAGNMIADVVMGIVNQIRLILAQGDKMVADFLVSVGNKVDGLPFIGDWFQGIAKEQADVAKKSAVEIEQLQAQIDQIDTRLSNPAGYRKMIEEQKKFAGKSSEVKEAVEKEAEALTGRNKAQKVAIDQGTRLLDQYAQDVIALKAQLTMLREHRDINDKISQQRKNLWNTQARFQVLEQEALKRKLTADEKSELANKSKILALREQAAIIGDQIVAEEQLIKREQDAAKFIREQEAKIAAIKAKAEGKSDRQAGREAEIEQLRQSWLSKGGSIEDQQLQEMIEKRKAYYAEEDALRGNWLAGVKSAWEEYGEKVKDVNGNIKDIALSALDGLSDELTNFLTTGEANFKGFASSILKMITQMIVKMTLFNAISSMMPGGKPFSFASMFSGKGFAHGGYTGDGGKYEPAGVVHKGEFVFTKEATNRIGAGNLYKLMRGYANGGQVGGSMGGGGATISGGSQFSFGDINVDVNNGNDPKGLETGVKMIFTEMIQRACSQGGEVYNFVNSKRG